MKIYEIMRKRVTAYSCAYITYRGNFQGLTKEFLLLATLTLTLKYREYGTLLYFQKAELMLDSEIFKDGLLTRFVEVFSSGSSEEVARFFDSNYHTPTKSFDFQKNHRDIKIAKIYFFRV